jgi:hypothetical protein
LGASTALGFCAIACTVFADLSNAQCSLDNMVSPFLKRFREQLPCGICGLS